MEGRGKSKYPLSITRLGTGLNRRAKGCQPGDRKRSRGGDQERQIPPILFVSEPTRDSAAGGHQADVWKPRFQTRSGPLKGGRMNALMLFASVSMQLQGRAESPQYEYVFRNMLFGNMCSNEPDLIYSCIEMEGQRIERSSLLQIVWNGYETAGRPNAGRITVIGVVEGLWKGDDLRFGGPS